MTGAQARAVLVTPEVHVQDPCRAVAVPSMLQALGASAAGACGGGQAAVSCPRGPCCPAMLSGTRAWRRSAADEELLASILAATTHRLAVDAMVSIIFSPGTARPFGALAGSLAQHGLPSCLVYGREDPWVVPLWGQRLKRLVPGAAYFEARRPRACLPGCSAPPCCWRRHPTLHSTPQH